ncbi:MAG: Holliday junction branch migration protein RuvA [Candidatus Campbellbacteria bacterium]|nr:Holliday junction branch migration protein RuvA [Candidatus Campbellbacteria bacterium]
MIRSIRGGVISVNDKEVVVESGGIGYRVFISSHTFSSIAEKESVSLWTHLAVRENSLDLYGFADSEELDFFELLLNISGIGPKSAMGILNIASLNELRQAIHENDPAYLTKVSGIGKKNAQKIVLELKGKIGEAEATPNGSHKEEAEAIEALTTLGYSTQAAREILREVPKDITETSERVRAALKKLGS